MDDFKDSEFKDLAVKEEIPTETIDAAMKIVRKREVDYKAKKKVSSAAKHDLDKAKTAFISLVKAAGKTRWEVAGYGGFSIIDKLKYRIPPGPDEMWQFIEFLRSPIVEELTGQPGDMNVKLNVTIQSQRLNSLCVQIKDLAALKGEDIDLPGVPPAKHEATLRSLPGFKGLPNTIKQGEFIHE